MLTCALIYRQMVDFQDDNYVSRATETLEESCQLEDASFGYVTELEGAKTFRRRK